LSRCFDLDITEKVELIERPPTEEVVTHEELVELFKTTSSPKHYIGLEISGFLHLGSLISTGFKINDFVKAGVNCTIFLADWHTMINDKLGGDWETITKVSKYYARSILDSSSDLPIIVRVLMVLLSDICFVNSINSFQYSFLES